MQSATNVKHPPLGSRLVKDLRHNTALYVFLIPAIVAVFVFNYLPMYGIQIAFRDFRPALGITGSPWAGLKHFERFFASYQFGSLLENTLTLSALSIVLGFPLPILMAIIFTHIRRKSAQQFTQTVAYMPHFISVTVVIGMLNIFLSPTKGLYGHLASLLSQDTVNIMGNAACFRPVYVLSDIWQHAGWDSVIYVAALSAVDTQLYDAAMVDGANQWKRLWHIDLPCILPTIIILLILRLGNVMNVGFEKALLMQNSLNLTTSEIIPTYVYKIGLINTQYSYSAAIGLFNSLINTILLISVNAVSNRVSGMGLW